MILANQRKRYSMKIIKRKIRRKIKRMIKRKIIKEIKLCTNYKGRLFCHQLGQNQSK